MLSNLANYIKSKLKTGSFTDNGRFSVTSDYTNPTTVVTEDVYYVYISVQMRFPSIITDVAYGSRYNISHLATDIPKIRNFITDNSGNLPGNINPKAYVDVDLISENINTRELSYRIKIPKAHLELDDFIWMDINSYGGYEGDIFSQPVSFVPYDPNTQLSVHKIRLSDPSFFNAAPILTLNTQNNQTLYENNTFALSGTTTDLDLGDTVTVKYQVNEGAVRTLSTAISNGSALPFTKNLTFKNKRLYDGSIVVSDELNGGTSHTLKVWAEDDKGGISDVQTRTFQVVPNRSPTVTLNTDNYQTLYERDTLLIYGSTKDVDNGDSVTVRYQINSGTVRNLHSTISDGASNIPFSKELTYSDGVLKDGNTVLTSALDEGSPHTLSVWSEDGNGGKSSVQSRTFHVVPNRPPVISVNPIALKSDLIPSETIEITGNVSDLDDNDVTVTFAINDGPTQSVREGAPGPFSFNVMLKDLDVGSNRITIKARDIYQAEVVKIVTINKAHDAVPINQAVALYKVNPPSGDARKILLWIERQLGDLEVRAEVSMTNEGDPENFVSIERTNSELKGVLQEDEFAYDAHEDKTNIIIKIIYNRNDAESQETIKKISGVLS